MLIILSNTSNNILHNISLIVQIFYKTDSSEYKGIIIHNHLVPPSIFADVYRR